MQSNLFLLILSGTFSSYAYAAHPLVTDDPGTQDQGNHQIEFNTDNTRHNQLSGQTGAITYSYGLDKNIDVFFNVPLLFSTPSGVADMSVGAKWRFYENGPFSAAAKPELVLPTGNADKGMGNGRASPAMLLIGAYQHDAWLFLGNVGAIFNRYGVQADQDDNYAWIWRTSVAAVYAVNEQWRLLADTGLMRNTNRTISTAPAYFLVGTIYSPRKQLDLDAGMKWGLNCRLCDAQTGRQFGVGLTWRF